MYRPSCWLSPKAGTLQNIQLLSGPDEAYMEYFAEADGKAAAFALCREQMEADMTTEAPRLKEMSGNFPKDSAASAAQAHNKRPWPKKP